MVSRLFQIVYILMENESVTAKELAEKLEVSVRTINRDVEKLSEARIPVYATRGRHGGISLFSDFVLNKKVFTEEEDRLIFTIPKAHESWFYDYIFSYGPYAEVLEPIEARMEMRKRAESICNRYQD